MSSSLLPFPVRDEEKNDPRIPVTAFAADHRPPSLHQYVTLHSMGRSRGKSMEILCIERIEIQQQT